MTGHVTGGDTVSRWLATWPTEDPALSNDDRYEFVLHAPLSRALRNVEVTLEHRRASDLLDEYFDCDVATWWRFAGWSSAQVGTFIRADLTGHVRLARALSVGNTDVYASTMPIAMDLIRGAPPLAALPDDSVVPTRLTFLAHAQALAEHVYRMAKAEPDRRRRGDLVLLGNLCLLAHEQELLERPLAVAARSHVRRVWGSIVRHPTWSQRQWRSTLPSDRVLRIENRVAARIMEIRPLVMPWGTIKIGDGVPGYRAPDPWPAMPEGLETWHPFHFFPPSGTAPACYLCLDQRLSFLYALLHAHGDATGWPTEWEDPWPGLERERRRAMRRHLVDVSRPAGCTTALPAGLELDEDRWHAIADDDDAVVDRIVDSSARADLAVARRIYAQNRHWIAIALLTRSLPATFTAADGASLLAPRVHGLKVGARAESDMRAMSGDAATRSARTLAFLDTLFLEPGDSFGSDATRAIAQTRRRHSMYRRDLIDARATNDVADRLIADRGVPVNAIDTVGTAVAFVVPVKRFFDSFAPGRVSDADWDAWARTWARLAEMVGAPHASVVTTDEQGDRYLDAAQMTAVGEYIDGRCAAPNLAGVFLLTNLVRDLEDAVPAVQRRLVRWAMSVYGDEPHTRLLLVPVSPLHRAARRSLAAVARTRLGGAAMNRVVGEVMRPVLDRLLGLEDRAKHELPLDVVFPPNCSAGSVSAIGAGPRRRGRRASRRSAASRSTAS